VHLLFERVQWFFPGDDSSLGVNGGKEASEYLYTELNVTLITIIFVNNQCIFHFTFHSQQPSSSPLGQSEYDPMCPGVGIIEFYFTS